MSREVGPQGQPDLFSLRCILIAQSAGPRNSVDASAYINLFGLHVQSMGAVRSAFSVSNGLPRQAFAGLEPAT